MDIDEQIEWLEKEKEEYEQLLKVNSVYQKDIDIVNEKLSILKLWKADRENYEKEFIKKLLDEMASVNSVPIETWKKKQPNLYEYLIKNGFVYKKEFDKGQMKDAIQETTEKYQIEIDNITFNLKQKFRNWKNREADTLIISENEVEFLINEAIK